MTYKIKLSKESKRDIRRLANYIEKYNYKTKLYKIIVDNIRNLTYMTRTHKTLYSFKDPKGEYRRIVSGKYIIIYKILNNQITILRVFSEKQNYLNLNNFILKEKSEKYLITK